MPKRGENIRKRKDGRWEGRYITGKDELGKTKYCSVYGKTYKEVKEKMQLSGYTAPQKYNQNISLYELIEMWLKNNHINHKNSTQLKYQFIIDNHIKNEIGKIPVNKLSSANINSFLNAKLENGRKDDGKGLSANYVRTMVVIIQSALKFGAQENLCSPLQSPVFKPKIEKKNINILTVSEQRKLEKYILSDMDTTKLGVFLSLYTGLRVGEVCALRWEDIDFNQQVININSTVAKIKCTDGTSKTKLVIDKAKTKASLRTIPVPIFVCQQLMEIKRNSISEFVISDKSTFLNPRTYEYRFHKILDECGIRNINYHALRHTFATRCIETDGDYKSLSEMLGHSSVAITMDLYVHPSDDIKRKQIEKIAGLTA